MSLSCQTSSEPAAMLIVHEVLPGTSHDSCSVLCVVLGPKRRDEMAVSIPLGGVVLRRTMGMACSESPPAPSTRVQAGRQGEAQAQAV